MCQKQAALEKQHQIASIKGGVRGDFAYPLQKQARNIVSCNPGNTNARRNPRPIHSHHDICDTETKSFEIEKLSIGPVDNIIPLYGVGSHIRAAKEPNIIWLCRKIRTWKGIPWQYRNVMS